MERSWLRRAAPLLAVSAGLVVLGTAVLLLAYATGAVERGSLPGGRLRWVDVNRERNLPTAWTTGLLLASSFVAARLRTAAWLLVAAVLALLTADEALQLHDRLDGIGALLVGDRLHFPWVLPALALAAPTAVVLLHGLRHEQPAVLRRLVLAGLLYVGGAAGGEVLSGAVLDAHGRAEGYVLAVALEEGLEMTGASLLLAALLMRRSRAASDAAPGVPGPRTPASTAPRPSRATPGG